jgi:carbon monoxide dehydrogenase subunit G
MRLNHRFTVPARVEDVWAAFNDLKRVAPHFPGATLESVRGDEFTGSIKIKFGPILLLYNGSGRIVERNQADRQLVIEAKGRDRRGQGSATTLLSGRFAGLEHGGTEIVTETDLTLTGRPAQFGQALISEVVDRLLDRLVHGVADQLTRVPVAAVPVPDAVDGREGVDVESEREQAELDRLEDLAAEAVGTEDELLDEEPVLDPRGDDADFATVPPTAPIDEADRPAAESPDSAAEAGDEPESEDFLTPTLPHRPEPAASDRIPTESRPPGVVEPASDSSGLRRYAPAAAAAVAGVTAVVVWALGRRRR